MIRLSDQIHRAYQAALSSGSIDGAESLVVRLRDFNAGTLQLFLGLLIVGSGATYGAARWIHSSMTGVPTTSGAVMLAALPILVGVQLLLGALNFDVQNVPREPLQRGGTLLLGTHRPP